MDAKNTTIVILLAIIAYFVRERQLLGFKASLHNVVHNAYLPPQQVHEKLKAHTHEFDKAEILSVVDGVYVAIGYALANTIILEADTSLIVIDTMESVEAAQRVRDDFKAMTPPSTHTKPVRTIIYTHYHPDHTLGTDAWIDAEQGSEDFPVIMSHPRTLKEMTRIFSIASTIANIRATRQFGPLLREYDETHSADANSSDLHENSGIGPFLQTGPKWTKSLQLPTKLLTDEHTTLNIDGVELEIVHAPGETVDQIFIYLPTQRVLFPADNVYRAYPNIYAIRGTPTRDARDWTKSLDKMRSLEPKPQILVPSHTQPVIGEHEIHELLTVYRDGIAYTHDQTIRYMNMGLTPDEMIPLIHEHMPARLKHHPHLQEFYGTVDWSVRGIFHSYLGWFSGDAADLFPLSKSELGTRLLALLRNDVEHLVGVIRQHIAQGKDGGAEEGDVADRNACQWALRLSTEAIHAKTGTLSEVQLAEVKALRIEALQCMASFMTSANGRNYYLTSALEEETDTVIGVYDSLKEFALNNMPMDHVMAMLRVRLKVGAVREQPSFANYSICHDLEDAWYLLELREGVIEIFKGTEGEEGLSDVERQMDEEAHIDRVISREECHARAEVVTECSQQTFRDAIAATKTTPAMLFASGKFKVLKGQITDMVQLRELFEKQ